MQKVQICCLFLSFQVQIIENSMDENYKHFIVSIIIRNHRARLLHDTILKVELFTGSQGNYASIRTDVDQMMVAQMRLEPRIHRPIIK